MINKSSQFVCLGWVAQPETSVSDPLILLAVSDLGGNVLSTQKALRFELVPDASDYRLQFSNAKTKGIRKTLGIDLLDGDWHFLAYVCRGEGIMSFYVDSIEIPPEEGLHPEGQPFSVAWSQEVRVGGGDVWCPYLYAQSQSVSLYNWRFTKNIQIHQQWIRELMAKDLQKLS